MQDKKVLKKIFSYPQRNRFLYYISLVLFSSQDFAFLGYTAFVQYLAISVIENNRIDELLRISIISILLYGIIIAVISLGMLLIDFVRLNTENALKYGILKHILYRKSKEIEVNDISSRIINDASAVAYFATIEVGTLLMPVISLIGSSILLFIIDIRIGVISLLTMTIPIIYSLVVLPIIKKIANRMVILNSEYLKKVDRGVQGISTIKLFNLIKNQIDYTKGVRTEIKHKEIIRSLINSLRTLVANGSNIVATLIVLTYAIRLYNGNDLTLAQIVIIPQILGGLLAGVEGTCSFSLNMQQPIASAKRIFEITDEELNEKQDFTEERFSENICSNELKAIEVENLEFSYQNNIPVIKNLSFTANNREITCLYAPIGSGKSTVIKLILGFLNEQQGTIKVFGQNKRDINEREWYRNFALVEQEPSLFNLTIEENILLGNSKKDYNKLDDILNRTGLKQMLEKLPRGMQTPVGSKGTSLSGGQKQLICLARALYSNAPIIVLDEFSSAMDQELERKVLDTIEYYKREKTFLLVSHRKSCRERADKIVEVI